MSLTPSLRPVAVFAGLLALATPAARSQSKPESVVDRVSYSIGHDVGENLKRDDLEINVEQVIQGLRDAIAGKDSVLSAALVMPCSTGLALAGGSPFPSASWLARSNSACPKLSSPSYQYRVKRSFSSVCQS